MVTLKKDQRIDLALLKETVKTTGFDLKWTDLQLTGMLIQAAGPDDEEMLAIQVPGTSEKIFLGPGETNRSRRNYVEVARWGKDQARLRLRGRAHAHADGSVGLSIESFEVVK